MIFARSAEGRERLRAATVALLRGVAATVGAVRWPALGRLGAMVGWLAGRVLRVRRAEVEASLRAAGIGSPRAHAAAMYRSLGTSLCEFLWLAARGDRATVHVAIAPSSLASWRAALAMKRGVVVAASHTGNWDLAACAVARTIELLVVTKRLSVTSLDRFWQATRAQRGVTLQPSHGALASARAVLRRAGAVAMMIDQVPDSRRHAIRVPFLDRPAWVDRAPAALAARAGAPLVVAASRRERSGEHVLVVLDALVPPARPGRDWIDDATIRATAALERFVRSYPSQWLWLHRRWREPLDRPQEARET